MDAPPYGKAKGKGKSPTGEVPYVPTSPVPRPSQKAVQASRSVLIWAMTRRVQDGEITATGHCKNCRPTDWGPDTIKRTDGSRSRDRSMNRWKVRDWWWTSKRGRDGHRSTQTDAPEQHIQIRRRSVTASEPGRRASLLLCCLASLLLCRLAC